MFQNDTIKRSLILMMVTAIIASPVTVGAAIAPMNAFHQIEIIDSETKELNLSLLEKIDQVNIAYRLNLADFIPYNRLDSKDTAEKVAGRIAGHSLENWLDSEDAKKSVFGKSAVAINNTLAPSLKGSNFTFRVKPLDTRAEVIFRGDVDATLSYEVDDEEVKLTVAWTF